MDEMSSVEFRKLYAKLTKPTVVTVLGRPIGTWLPVSVPVGVVNPDGFLEKYLRPLAEARAPFLSERPFTPAPKPGKR